MPQLGRRPAKRPSRSSPGEAGVAILEVLVASIVVGIAAAGIALMYSFGSTWVVAKGDDRVALSLAQQKIEQLRSLGFNCIPVFGPGTLGQVRGPNGGCTATQVYNEGATTWVTADGTTASAPSNRNFTRLTTVEYVSDTAVGTVSGPATNTKRITVTVQPSQERQADAPVILQAWITVIPGGI